jgi:GNAT superfamily N-acetyltransferase
MNLRHDLVASDPDRIRKLVCLTGFFHADEVTIAEELALEQLGKGEESGYHFILAENDGSLTGYACYGPIPCTRGSYDLYWIAVHPDHQGQGLGRLLLYAVEDRIRTFGGRRIYADTSQRPQYQPTRAFYQRCGFCLETVLTDFYDEGDGKAIYCKVLL